MKLVRTVADLRSELAPARGHGSRVGLVPTMGALHEGHLSLIRTAAAECDVVVVSLFVNPAQFNERADLDAYPRSEQSDAALAHRAGASVLFAPSVEEVYPAGFSTFIEVLGVTERLEGASRGAEHFRGVATVVGKLLAMAGPDVAYFGQKDFQQVLVIRRLVADLNMPVQIRALPTVREPDGLAMSSRNALLGALALPAALRAAQELASEGERSAERLIAVSGQAMESLGVSPEYIALVDPDTLEPVHNLHAPALLALAARVGAVRLIDNTLLEPAPSRGARTGQHEPHHQKRCRGGDPSGPAARASIASQRGTSCQADL